MSEKWVKNKGSVSCHNLTYNLIKLNTIISIKDDYIFHSAASKCTLVPETISRDLYCSISHTSYHDPMTTPAGRILTAEKKTKGNK